MVVTPLLLGGEMPHWSDPEPAGGAVLRALAAGAHGDTLVVGPHSPELIAAITARHVTVLLRGVPDGEALPGRPGLEVCCGSLEKLAAVPAYDTVVALDGLERTGSTESPGPSWADGLAQLLAVLRPGGRLLLGLANPVGVHDLLAGAADPGDAQWSGPPGDDPTRPVGAAALRDRLRSVGLDPLREYAVFPSPRHPTVLLGTAALADPALTGFLSSALRRTAPPPGPLLADPRPVAARLLRHGLAGAMAPGWVVVATKTGDSPLPPARPSNAASSVASSVAGLPETLIADGPVLRRLSPAPGRGWVHEDLAEDLLPVPRELPAGECLHDLLMVAGRGHDLPALRSLVTGWRDGPAAGVPADAVLVAPDGRYQPLAAPGEPAEALRRFADAVRDEGLPAEIAEIFGVMTGRRIRPGGAALRELTAERDRLARELGEAITQNIWYERQAASRDAELARAYRIIALLKGTVPGRAATAVRGGLRTGTSFARAALRRIRQP
ncbi:hypothetical protein [Actinoplanes rectilineatus]|uniref:hypothetical protein n=1 Tax=Actinoplanes rectilineatus TaxID=113571 RepID=UPI0005F29731|nr:hypothetical protein [Actinoplanes rectilineatus]